MSGVSDSESLDRCLSLEDSNIDNSNQESLDMSYQGSVSMDTSYHGSSSILSGSNQGSFSFFNADKRNLEDTKSKFIMNKLFSHAGTFIFIAESPLWECQNPIT